MTLTLEIRRSQNHSMVGVERDLWNSSCSNPMLKQGYLEGVARNIFEWSMV